MKLYTFSCLPFGAMTRRKFDVAAPNIDQAWHAAVDFCVATGFVWRELLFEGVKTSRFGTCTTARRCLKVKW